MALVKFQRSIVGENGDILPNAEVDIFLEGTATRASIYSDSAGSTPITNPTNADANGLLSFYITGGRYDIIPVGSDGWTDEEIIELENTLTSTSTAKALTASMGKSLQDTKIAKVISTDNAIVRFDGTTGDIQNNTGAFINDSGYVGFGTNNPLAAIHLDNGKAIFNDSTQNNLSFVTIEGGDGGQNDASVNFYAWNGASASYGARNFLDGGLYKLQTAAAATYGSHSWVTNLILANTGNTYPGVDNSYSLGIAANRFSEIFAGTGTINTSDERTKTFSEILSAELAVAKAINMRKFQYNDAIERKGVDNARYHFGVSAQEVKAIFEANGLDAMKYGIVCYDTWDAEIEKVEDDAGDIIETHEEQAYTIETKVTNEIEVIDGIPTLKEVTKEVKIPLFEDKQVVDTNGEAVLQETTTFDEDGTEVVQLVPLTYKVPMMQTIEKRYKEVEVRPAGDLYGIRYEELYAFIISAL